MGEKKKKEKKREREREREMVSSGRENKIGEEVG